MTRRRYVQIDGELIEVGQSYIPVPRTDPRMSDSVLWNDRAYQDMNDPRFNSRSSHREYMKRNNLTTIDDFRKHDAKQAQSREEFYRGVDRERRADIMRAMEKKQVRG